MNTEFELNTLTRAIAQVYWLEYSQPWFCLLPQEPYVDLKYYRLELDHGQ